MGEVLDRFVEKVDFSGDCWLWTGAHDKAGYGNIWVGGTAVGGTARTGCAHRVAYELSVGPIPDGLDLDHLCRVPACVNPDHLEPVTRRENLRRGKGISAQHAAQTHCIHGHSLESAYITRTGSRICRVCRRDRMRKYVAERRNG